MAVAAFSQGDVTRSCAAPPHHARRGRLVSVLQCIDYIDQSASPAAASVPSSCIQGRVQRIRSILESVGTNLHHVSKITRRAPYGSRTDFAIPHWFYSELAHGSTPHICQVIALSQITGYRLVDWMSVFGYCLDDIPRLQVSLRREAPAFVSSVTYDKNLAVEWFAIGSVADDVLERTQPLSEVIGSTFVTTVGRLEQARARRYLYLKVGDQDGTLYPRVGAGSVLRIDPERTEMASQGPPPVFAVQWHNGLLLTFLKAVPGASGTVVLPPRFPASEQTLGRDLTVLGTADCEVRPLRDEPLPKSLDRSRPPRHKKPGGGSHAGHLVGKALRRFRERAGLNLREVHALTVQVSELTGDASAVVSQSCLFRYELASTLPHHISKIVSLCIVYGISLWELLDAAGVRIDPDGGRALSPVLEGHAVEPRVVSTAIVDREPWRRILAEIPFFLRGAMPALMGQRDLSLDAIYTCGTRLRANNPLFQSAIALTVDSRQRSVERVKAQAKYREPMFLVRGPSGQYLSGACSIQNGTLTIQPRLQAPTALVSFPRNDVEIVGRITGVVRLLDPESEVGFPPR